ncbi:MAG TPA: hypothetical protein VGE97_05840 [Nitrososphaera sp.]
MEPLHKTEIMMVKEYQTQVTGVIISLTPDASKNLSNSSFSSSYTIVLFEQSFFSLVVYT